MTKSTNVRDKLRQTAFKRKFKSEIIKWEGVEYELRQPSIAGRNEIRKYANVEDTAPISDFLVWCVIFFTYVPGTDVRVFDPADFDSLVASPAGGLVDMLSLKASAYLNVNMEETEKNSETTQKDVQS